MKRTAVLTAKELLGYLLDDARFQPDGIFDAVDRGARGQIFRGQRDVKAALIPSAHRDHLRLKDFTPQPPAPLGNWPAEDQGLKVRSMRLVEWLHAEIRAVQRFLDQADKLGLATPIDYMALHAHQPLLDEVLTHSKQAAQRRFPEPAYLPAVAMAQHQGVPTRLLDWTESSLVAAYFAVCKVSKALTGYEATAGEEVGVFVFNTRSLSSELKGKIEVASAPRHANHHLRAQRGLFLYMPTANDTFFKTGQWPSIEAVLEECGQSHELDMVTLPASEADSLLRLLWRYDVTRHHLMPTLSNAALTFQYERALFDHRKPR